MQKMGICFSLVKYTSFKASSKSINELQVSCSKIMKSSVLLKLPMTKCSSTEEHTIKINIKDMGF